MELHRSGQLAEAAACYLQVLQINPGHFEARYLLGVLRLQQGRLDEALDLIEAALKAKPDSIAALLNRGLILHAMKRCPEALTSYDTALSLNSANAEALNGRGNVLADLGRFEEALASYDRALVNKPNYAEALTGRGCALAELSRYDEALTSYVKVLLIRPDFAEGHFLRGNVLARLARFENALKSYDKAIALRPDFAEAYDNRGNALTQLERHGEALASYDKALAIRPDYAGAWYNRANLLADTRPSDALASYDRALAIWPDHAGALNGRGNVLQALGRYEDAIGSYRNALAINPNDAEVLYNRGGAERGLDRHDEALACFDKALAIRPQNAEVFYARGASLRVMNRWREALESYQMALSLKVDYSAARIALCMAELPVLYANEAEIAERRTAYAGRLKALSDDVDRMGTPGDLADSVGSIQPFFLAYQGRNDRDLQSIYGSIVCRIMADRYPPPALAPPPALNEPIRVGIVSGFFRRHANWKIPIKGWLEQLDRHSFRVFGYHTGANVDAETDKARSLCERFVQGPMTVDRWRQEIATDAPHVLIYPEVGMDAASAQLAAQRLAAVQCNSWGHPDTSGLPTLDYYLSSDLMEPPNGQDHYTEQLVRLPGLSVYCDPIDRTGVSLDRQELGLRPSACIYWCAQSLYKYLPQFDDIFPHIAREAGDCQFVFIEYQRSPKVTELFRQRLDRAFADVGLRAEEHCVVLPPLDQQRFIAATGLSDVFLDSIGWSGCNSTMEALAYDLPVVTMKGDLMRGRHSAAMLEMMDVTPTIAETKEQYVAAAIRLARDVGWRIEIKNRISANKHRLYQDRTCITALEEFLRHVARRDHWFANLAR